MGKWCYCLRVQCVNIKNPNSSKSKKSQDCWVNKELESHWVRSHYWEIFCSQCKKNEWDNKFLLDKFMTEMHLREPCFTYNACGPFTKNKIQKFKEAEDSKYIYKNELDDACFYMICDMSKIYQEEQHLTKYYMIGHLKLLVKLWWISTWTGISGLHIFWLEG